MKDKPLISVCIPAYNNAKVIKNTIDSIINQTYDNWELIISDDCSKDNTVEVVKSYNDPRIRIIEHKANLGMARNFNFVIGEAKGEYIKLICGDDTIDPDCLEKQIDVFTSGKYPSVVLVISNRRLIDNTGKVIMTRKFPFKKGFVSSKIAIFLNILFGTNVIGEPHVGLMSKKTFSLAGNFEDTNPYCVDLDFWFKVLLVGDMYVIPETLASFRISKGSSTTKIKNSHAKLFREFMKRIHLDRRYKVNLMQYYVACFSSSIMQVLRHSFMYIYSK